MSDLFADRAQRMADESAPLATRFRPDRLDDVVGQESLLKSTSAFHRIVSSGHLASMLFWGPPGTGKTTLARIVAKGAEASFETLSATSAGVRDIRQVLARARNRLEIDETRTVLFLDEIHRFAKNQQDALLPGVEDGTLVLIGATTENPYFEVNSPLLSRMTVFRLEPIEPADIGVLVDRALADSVRGLGSKELQIDAEARDALSARVGGDARTALNGLEVAALLAEGAGRHSITADDVAEALQRRVVTYDKEGDRHFDVISAFIKSIRGSDPDAALYWLFLMLDAGEDPEFIARRLIVLASEDVGLADPNGLVVAIAAADALAYVGVPEAHHHLAHATLFLACSPKSNSIPRAMSLTRAELENHWSSDVPPHLRATDTRSGPGAKSYVYPHDHEGAVVDQHHFPSDLRPRVFYRPGDQGDEPALAERLRRTDAILRRVGRESLNQDKKPDGTR